MASLRLSLAAQRPLASPQRGLRAPRSRSSELECGQRPCSTRLQAVAEVDSPSTSEPLLAGPTHWPAPGPSRIVKNNRAFVEEHRIRGYEVGPDQKTSIVTIANLLQEVASNHAVAMWGRSSEGFATHPALLKDNLIFVMTRMQIQIECYPSWGDMIEIETWFQQHGKLGAQRDFTIRSADGGRVLGRATSTWVMINMQTRRLAKMPDVIRAKLMGLQMKPPVHAIDPQYTRLKLPDLDEPVEIVGHPQLARRADMDMNGHINNVTYINWALESVPAAVYDSNHLYQVEIDFKAECKSGEMVETLAQRSPTEQVLASNGAGPDSLSFVHSIRRCKLPGDCTELVRCRTTWRAGEPLACD